MKENNRVCNKISNNGCTQNTFCRFVLFSIPRRVSVHSNELFVSLICFDRYGGRKVKMHRRIVVFEKVGEK